jgi:hypothetical protein
METSEPLPGDAVEAPDLAELIRGPGPFLSVHVRTDREVVNAAPLSVRRWKNLRRDLEHRDVPDAILREIDGLVPDAHLHGESFALIADAERVLHVEHGPALGGEDFATWGPFARVLPILRWRQSQPPYVVVLTDRTGADLFAFRRGSPDLHAEIEGEHDVIRKVHAGGWSQRRYQERAEDSWEHNAEQVADRVTRFVERIGPAFVVVAGDVRAVSLLRGALPERVAELVRVVGREYPRRQPGEEIPPEVDELVDGFLRDAERRLLDRFGEERGQRDKATVGLEDTVEALERAQVAVLLIADAGDDERSLWFGPEPSLVATVDRDLKELGVDSPEPGPARDVLVRAALGTGAGVRVLDAEAGIEDGVGALLRWR